MTDKLELHIIEIPKAIKQIQNEPKNRIAQWMLFLSNPNDEEVTKIMEENKAIGQAMGKLKELSADEELRRVAELRQKAILDEKAIKRRAEEIGREEGLKQGLQEGTKRGLKEGMKKGIMEGQKQKEKEIAKRMLAEKIDIDVIVKITGLSKKEIENLSSLNS
ncbi:MAG: Rpn family recombination-promoting nuclease/putative transposase [Clostridia bacterium]